MLLRWVCRANSYAVKRELRISLNLTSSHYSRKTHSNWTKLQINSCRQRELLARPLLLQDLYSAQLYATTNGTLCTESSEFPLAYSGKRDKCVAFTQGHRSKTLQLVQPAVQQSTEPHQPKLLMTLICSLIGTAYIMVNKESKLTVLSTELLPESTTPAESLNAKHLRVNLDDVKVTLDDVHGCDEIKAELRTIVNILKNPQKYKELGAQLPKGYLLIGPTGVGKTLLARAVAGEAKVPFFHILGAELDETSVDARLIHQLVADIKAAAPCILFIDGLEAVKKNGSYLLREMDGIDVSQGIVVIGATNAKYELSDSVLHSGRFDIQLEIRCPDLKGRQDILQFYLSKVKHDADIDLLRLARITGGSTGAELRNAVNLAAVEAAVEGKSSVSMKRVESALDKIFRGVLIKSVQDSSVITSTAYHEAGHALVGYYSKATHKVFDNVTIQHRGKTLGVTTYTREERANFHYTKEDMLHDLDIYMAGRAAEEILNGAERVSTGSSDDMSKATRIATDMVKDYGFSEKLGLRVFPYKCDQISPKVQADIDEEIKLLLKESYERAKRVLYDHREELQLLAEALLKHEFLTAEEVRLIIEREKLEKISQGSAC